MDLPNGDKMLVNAMDRLGATEDEVVGMMLALKTKEQKKEMLHWIYHNQKATTQEMIRASSRISGLTAGMK